MASDRPDAAELLDAIREFLERDVMAATEGRVQFHTRVAINGLNMVTRELRMDPTVAAEERKRVAAILGHDGTPADLERELAARIRDGSLDASQDDVRAHVRAAVRNKLLLANPDYLPGDE